MTRLGILTHHNSIIAKILQAIFGVVSFDRFPPKYQSNRHGKFFQVVNFQGPLGLVGHQHPTDGVHALSPGRPPGSP